MYRVLIVLAFLGSIAWLYLEPSPEPVVSLLLTFAGFFRDELHGVVGKNFLSLTPRNKLIREIESSKYSFISPNFINPRIIEDLLGWLSDSGRQVVSVDISGANESNRYFCDISIEQCSDSFPKVVAKYEEGNFSYKYIGRSFSGMHIIQTWSWGGGSGVFCNILLVTLSMENCLDYRNGKSKKYDGFVIKLIGVIPLGDRYVGDIKYKLGFLVVPACNGMASIRKKRTISLII